MTHVRHIEQVFQIFKADVHDWTVCSIADNCSVYSRLAHLLDVPHVGCLSHKLNLEVKAMLSADSSLQNMIDLMREKMLQCKRNITHRITHCAMMRNFTHLSPVIHNVTHWSSKYVMLKLFKEI